MRIALYFGSFNPLHVGHLALANYIVEYGRFDELWFVVSPRNPFKQDQELLPDELRLRIVSRAIEGYDRFRASDVEFSLPKPSYTVDTLRKLCQDHPSCQFSLLMGSDNYDKFPKWKNVADIMKMVDVLIYPRNGYPINAALLPEGFSLISAPCFDVSSTFIRKSMAAGLDVRYFLHPTTLPLLEGVAMDGVQ